MTRELDEVGRHFTKVTLSVSKLKTAGTGSELRDAWEEFLHSFARTIGRLITLGMRSDTSRSWGYRLKNASTKDDEGLIYLREARNAAEHGLTPCADFRERSVDVGGIARLGGNSQISITGCYLNGQPMTDFTAEAREGRLHGIGGKPNVPIVDLPARIILTPILSEEKGTRFNVPETLDGQAIDSSRPVELAMIATDFLSRKVTDFQKKRF